MVPSSHKITGLMQPLPDSDYMNVTKGYVDVSDVVRVTIPGGENVAVRAGDRLSLHVAHAQPAADAVTYTLRVNAPVPVVPLWKRVAMRIRYVFRR